ncbi:MAG: DUF3102 domain-containing protein [Phascolarctobacterium sp.]
MNEMQATRTPAMVAAEINLIKDQTRKLVLTNSILIGQKLKEAQLMVEHGQWGKWLAEEVEFSVSTANNLMRVYEEYGADQGVLFGSAAKSQALENLSYTQAVLLLGVPKEEREDFIKEARVEEISTRELQAKVKEYKEAKENAERRTADAEHARAVAVSEANKALANCDRMAAKVAEHEEKAKELRAEATMSANQRDEAVKKVKKLKGEVKTLKQQLVDASEETKKVAELENEKQELNKRISELEAELAKPVTMEAAKEIVEVEKVPEAVQRELEELRAKVAENAHQLRDEQAKLAYKEKFKQAMSYINALFNELGNVANEDMRYRMTEAFKAVLEQSLGVAKSRLSSMEADRALAEEKK